MAFAPSAQLNPFWEGNCDGCHQCQTHLVHFWLFEAQHNTNHLDRLCIRQKLALWMNIVSIQAGCRYYHQFKQVIAPLLLLL